MRYLMLFTIGFVTATLAGCYLPDYLWIFFAAVCLLGGVCLLLLRKFRRQTFLLMVGALIGILWFAAFSIFALSAPKALDATTRNVTMIASDFSYETEYGIAVDGKLSFEGRDYSVKIYLNTTKHVLPGDVISGQFRLRYTGGGAQPATYHIGNGMFLLAYPEGDPVVFQADDGGFRYLPVRLRHWTLQLIDEIFPEDTAGFARSLLLGDDSQLDDNILKDFSLTGVRHIIAVSGLHVSIFLGMICFFTKKRPILTAVIGMPILLLFAALVGFTPSIIRACIMQMLLWIALCVDKEYDGLTALSVAALVVLVQNPMAASSVSFQLSFGSVTGILLFSAPIQNYFKSFLGKKKYWKVLRLVTGSLSISIAANVLIIPLMAHYFGTVSLIGVLANLLILWVVPIVFGGVLLACSVGAFWIGGACAIAGAVSLPIQYILAITNALAEIPLAAVYTQSIFIVMWIVFSCCLVVILMLQKRKRPIFLLSCCVFALCVAVLLSFLLPLGEEYRMSVLDVGQGQCILLHSDGKTFMVDCGGDNSDSAADLAIQTLYAQGITRLDGLVLTHYDADHAGGVASILSRMQVDTLFLPALPDDAGMEAAIKDAAKGNVVTVEKDMMLTFGETYLSIFSSQDLDSTNESSLCVLFQKRNCDILITGDRSTTGELMLLQTGRIPDIDILVAGHHGSESSTGEFLLKTTKPETVIISVGADNRYGHPSDTVLERLNSYGCTVRRTDLEGTIIIRG